MTAVQTPLEEQTGAPIAVPRIVSDAQVQSYLRDGFLAVENLVTGDELQQLKRDVVRVARGDYGPEGLDPLPPDAGDAEVLDTVLCIHQPHHVSPVIRDFVRHERICGVLAQITGAHLPWWDGSVKCMQSMYFVKPPGFQGQAWHQDEIYIPTRDRSLLGAWIAVDDATVRNGCLWVLAGSHRKGYLYPQREHGNRDEFDNGPESYGFDKSDEQPVEVSAGTVVFFNSYLLHRSRRNRGNTYRRVLVNHYMNAWSLLPWHPKENERPANADHRAVETVAGVDPYAWKGYEEPPRRVYLRRCKANEAAAAD